IKENLDAAADVAFDVKENQNKVYVSLSSSDKLKKHDEKAKREAKGKSPVDLSTGNTAADVAFDVKENQNKVYVSLSSSDKLKKHDEKAKREAKGKSPVDLSTGVRDLKDEFEEFSSNNTNRVNAANAPVTAVRPNPTNNTNNFNAASPSDNAVSLNFEIGGKSSFVDPSQYPDDLYMPALEDIGHTQEEGIDYEEVVAPVARIEAIWLFLAYASFMGFIFEDPDYPDKVYKVVKALYRLYQAPRAWKFGLTYGKSASTPIDTEKPLLKDPDGEDVDVHIYMSMIVDEKVEIRITAGDLKVTTVRHFITAVSYKLMLFGLTKDAVHLMLLGHNMVRNMDSPSKFLMYPRFLQVLINNQVDDLSSHTTKYTFHALTQKEPITSPPQAQPAPPSSPPQQPTTTSTSDLTLLNTLMETCTTLSHKVAALEQDKVAQALEIFKLKQKVKRLEKKRRSKHSSLKRLRKVGTSQRVKSSTETVMGAQEDASKQKGRGRIKAIDVDEDITLIDMETKVELDAELQERIERKDDDNAAVKEVNAAEPTVFDDKEVTMTMAQTLIKMKAEKVSILDEQMAKRLHDEEIEQAAAREKQEQDDFKRAQELQQHSRQEKHDSMFEEYGWVQIVHFKGMTYGQVRPIFEREYNKVQTFLKLDRDEEPSKKRVAKETLLQESFKKLGAEILGSHSTQDTPTNDPREMSEEDVKNTLQIVLVSKFKVEDLQVKVGGITQAYKSFEDILKDFDREDLDAMWRLVKEKFSTSIPTEDKENALWVELKRLCEPNAADVF
nr:hypothetical protein [Tanacetum cinerariifolium]